MSWSSAGRIARALLYEGYLLYPYRPSALKNQYRWTFGVLYPEAFCLRERAGDRWSTQTECLVEGNGGARLAVKARFLQCDGASVEEREVSVEELPLDRMSEPERRSFRFPPVEGALEIGVRFLERDLLKVRLRVENRTSFAGEGRQQALASSLLSCHTMLKVEGGRFLSLTDPPEDRAVHAERCENLGVWPVLVGGPGQQDLVLSSPIILPDYPAVAPESPGDLFDGTEIDEILTLRILTLGEAEKEEVRGADERARRLLERTEALSPAQLADLHATLRAGATPPQDVRPGQRVRLRPRGRADIFDLELRGREATILSVEEDLDGGVYLSVTVDDDPGRDLGRLGHPGHRFFFRPDEVELL